MVGLFCRRLLFFRRLSSRLTTPISFRGIKLKKLLVLFGKGLEVIEASLLIEFDQGICLKQSLVTSTPAILIICTPDPHGQLHPIIIGIEIQRT